MKINRLALFLGAGILMASCTGKSVPSKTDTDDLYVKSGDLVLPGSVSAARTQAPAALPYDDSFDPATEGFAGGSDEYFDENYLTSKDLRRNVGSGAGYSDGYADGYSQGWSDNSWTYAGAGRFWNSPYGFNSFYPSFGTGMFFSYSPYFGFGNSWNMGWNMGWGSRWGSGWGGWYDPWDPFYGSYAYGWGGGFGRFNSPWGYNPYYSSWGDPWGYGWGNPYYGRQTILVNNIYNGRTVRQRNATMANSRYNDQLVSRSSANNARVSAVDRGSRSAVSRSASSREVNSSARMGSTADRSGISRSSGVRSYDTYSRGNAVNSARTSQSAGSRVQPSSGRGGTYTPAARQSAPTYNRSGNTGRSSSPAYNSGSSRGSSSSPAYNNNSGSRSSSPSYSAPSRSSSGSSSSGSSSSGSSRSSGGSSSSGGGSRGRG